MTSETTTSEPIMTAIKSNVDLVVDSHALSHNTNMCDSSVSNNNNNNPNLEVNSTLVMNEDINSNDVRVAAATVRLVPDSENNFFADSTNYEYSTDISVSNEYKDQEMLQNWDSMQHYDNQIVMLQEEDKEASAGIADNMTNNSIDQESKYYVTPNENHNTVKITNLPSNFANGSVKYEIHQQSPNMSMLSYPNSNQVMQEDNTNTNVDQNGAANMAGTVNSTNSYMLDKNNANLKIFSPNTLIINGAGKMGRSMYCDTQQQMYMPNIATTQNSMQISEQNNNSTQLLPEDAIQPESQIMPTIGKKSIIIDPNFEYGNSMLQSINHTNVIDVPEERLVYHHDASNNSDSNSLNNCEQAIYTDWNLHYKDISTDNEMQEYSHESKRHWGTGRKKIEIKFIEKKLKRQITFSKRKAGMMKKIHELATLTGAQALLVLVSETGHIYSYATSKLSHLVADEQKNIIKQALDQQSLKNRDNLPQI